MRLGLVGMALIAAATLASCAGTGKSVVVPPAAVAIGPEQACVQTQSIRETRVIDDSTIDFVLNGGKVLRNHLPNSCPQLGFERAFSSKLSTNQLCSVEIITVIYQGGGPRQGASCGLGKFTPIAPPKK